MSQEGQEIAELQQEELTPEPPAAPVRPVRVAWVAGPQTLDKYGRILQPLAIGLMDELVQVTAFCPQHADLGSLPSPPMRIVPYGRLDWWAFWAAKVEDLASQVAGSKIEVIHALDVSAAPLAERLSRALGVKYVVSSYGLDDGRAIGRLASKPAAILAASTAILKDLRRRRFIDAQRVHLLRPGVYQVRHATCFVEPQYSITVVAGGRLDDYVAFEAVLKSFAELSARKYDCAYFVIANGRFERQLRALSEKMALRHELTFADQQPAAQLPGIFKAADIYIAPSGSRQLDVHCLLAMAAGVPVLTTSPGADDFLRDGQTTMVFPKGDSVELTAKLVGLLEDRASARSLAENALAYLRENHSPANRVVELAQIYRGTVDETAVAKGTNGS